MASKPRTPTTRSVQIPAPAGTEAFRKKVRVPPSDLAKQLNPSAPPTFRWDCSYCSFDLTEFVAEHGGTVEAIAHCPKCRVKFGEPQKRHCVRCDAPVQPGLSCTSCGQDPDASDEDKIAIIKVRLENTGIDTKGGNFRRQVKGILLDEEELAEATREARKGDWIKKAEEGTLFAAPPFEGSPSPRDGDGQGKKQPLTPGPESAEPPLVMIQYHPDDSAHCAALRQHLKLYERNHILRIWDMSDVLPGCTRDLIIAEQYQAAKVIVWLVSSSSVAETDYSIDDGKRHIPVKVSPCMVMGRIAGLQSPLGGQLDESRAITQISDRNDAWMTVAQKIARAVGK